MKVLQGGPEVEVLAIMAGGGAESLQLIERAGRTAYQSQERITEDSAEKFVRKLRRLGHESVLEHSAMTARFKNCSRGLTHELVRHRLASFTQESTRYVDESDFKVVLPPSAPPAASVKIKLPGPEGGLEVSLAQWLEWNEAVYRKLRAGDYRIEGAQGQSPARSWPPQDARQLLPIGISAEIVVSANFREWRHIFALRTARPAHWEIRSAMGKLLEMVKQRVPVIFDDFVRAGVDNDGIAYYSQSGK